VLDRGARFFASAALATLALFARGPSVWAASVAAESPEGLMRRVAAASSDVDRAIVGYHSDSELHVDAGPYHHTSTESRWFVLQDGKLVATGLRANSGPSLGKGEERQSHEPWGAYVSEYTFERAACPECVPGTEAISFSSAIHDADHGSGVLIVDTARAVVLREHQAPYDFGGMAKSGSIDVTFGETELGWRPRAVVGDFQGNVGPFNANAHLEDTLHDYKRYPTVESAIAALST
jgi:hypothetical protein